MICRVEVRVDGVMICRVDGCVSARSSPMYQGARLFCSGPPRFNKEEPTELAYIDILGPHAAGDLY